MIARPAALGSLIVLQSLLYGFGDPISKIAYERLPVPVLLTLRFALALLPLGLLLYLRQGRRLRSLPWRECLPAALCIALCYILSNVALSLTEATSVAFLRSLAAVITPFLAWLLLKRRYARSHLLPLLGAIAGLYLLCAKGGLSGFGAGEIITLCSSTFMALSLVYSARSLDSADPLLLTTMQVTCCALLAALFSVLSVPQITHPQAWSVPVWAIILYLAYACTLAGFWLQNLALRGISAARVALLQSSAPVFTALFSWLLLDERLSYLGMLGAGLIVVCVAAEALLKE